MDDSLFNEDSVEIRSRLLGGKGGFGQNLKEMGEKMSATKSTNFSSCRDLQGRRLRTVKQHQILENWAIKERQRFIEKEEKVLKKMQRNVDATHKKYIFKDVDFLGDCKSVVEKVDDDVSEGIKTVLAQSSVEKPKVKGPFDIIPDISSEEE